ncbi:uncharacterized protein [Asterias amurensis]|uniref:uncharacterized protein n=1 Tax=Asterias amurensis TaxID=7602 RepID=UPI003AB86995
MHTVMYRIQLVCVLLFLGALLVPSVITADYDVEVRSFNDTMIALTETLSQNFADQDWDEEMAMWLPNAYLLMEGIPPVNGMEAIRQAMRIDPPPDAITTEYLEVAPNEEGADYVYVLYIEKWHDYNGNLIGDKKCLAVWRNTDQGYKVAIYMVNSNV